VGRAAHLLVAGAEVTEQIKRLVYNVRRPGGRLINLVENDEDLQRSITRSTNERYLRARPLAEAADEQRPQIVRTIVGSHP